MEIFNITCAFYLFLEMPNELQNPRAIAQCAKKRRVVRVTIVIRVFIVAQTKDGVSKGLCYAEKGVVDTTWERFGVALFCRQIVVVAIEKLLEGKT